MKVPSVCFIDGDSRQTESPSDRIYRLPGQSPESHVFDQVMASWDAFGGKLAVALLQKFENAGRVKAICDEVRLTNRDPHLLLAQVGERLGLLPETTVAAAFANIWAQAHPEDLQKVLEPIRTVLPSEEKAA